MENKSKRNTRLVASIEKTDVRIKSKTTRGYFYLQNFNIAGTEYYRQTPKR